MPEPPRPPAPGDSAAAYLDLLKRALCDLLGAGTETAVWQPDGTVVIEELTDLSRRENGEEWPARGATMVGLRRLDQLQTSIEAVVRDGVPGDMIETGVWRGGAAILMRATLATLGVSDREVWLADSFEGLPKAKPDLYPADAGADILSTFDFLSVSEDEVRAAFERYGLLDEQVRFLRGWFSDTLPPLRGKHTWSLLRLDGDHYESTIVALESLYPDLSPGGFVVIDDYAIAQCQQAVNDFRQAHGIEEPLHEVDWTGVWWRRSSS